MIALQLQMQMPAARAAVAAQHQANDCAAEAAEDELANCLKDLRAAGEARENEIGRLTEVLRQRDEQLAAMLRECEERCFYYSGRVFILEEQLSALASLETRQQKKPEERINTKPPSSVTSDPERQVPPTKTAATQTAQLTAFADAMVLDDPRRESFCLQRPLPQDGETNMQLLKQNIILSEASTNAKHDTASTTCKYGELQPEPYQEDCAVAIDEESLENQAQLLDNHSSLPSLVAEQEAFQQAIAAAKASKAQRDVLLPELRQMSEELSLANERYVACELKLEALQAEVASQLEEKDRQIEKLKTKQALSQHQLEHIRKVEQDRARLEEDNKVMEAYLADLQQAFNDFKAAHVPGNVVNSAEASVAAAAAAATTMTELNAVKFELQSSKALVAVMAEKLSRCSARVQVSWPG